jgi:exosome complex exonuclease RRP6
MSIAENGTQQNPQAAMREVLERSAETALRVYEREPYDILTGRGTNGWLALSRKLGKGVIEEESGFVFKRLHAWRDMTARKEDESPL